MRSKIIHFIVCMIMSGIVLVKPAYAATITVSPGQSIQSAINSSSSGDTITVGAGTYNEKIGISKSNLIIQANGKTVTKSINVSGNTNTIKGFTITDPNENYGIMVTGNNNIIEDNEIYHTKQDGIWFFGIGNIFRGNYIHDILSPSICGSDLYTLSCDPHVDCYQTWGSHWETRDIVFDGNFCNHNRKSGSNQSVMFENQSAFVIQNVTFQNNVFIMHDSGYSIMNFHRKAGQNEIRDISVLNNTFYNTTLQGEEAIKFSGVTGGRITNNVSIGFSDIAKLTNGSAPTISNNVTSDPYGMVDFTNLNFHLTTGSPLIDTGVTVGVTTDYDGKTRNSTPDIGAFEYSGESGTISTNPSPSPSQKLGDANNDNKVDGIDYVVWINHYNQNISGTTNGDFNNSGKVDGVDYVVWLNNYGR